MSWDSPKASLHAYLYYLLPWEKMVNIHIGNFTMLHGHILRYDNNIFVNTHYLKYISMKVNELHFKKTHKKEF